MSTCLIISGGKFSTYIPNIQFDYVIACDAGVLNAHRLGIRPDLIIGDFDSFSEPIPAEFSDIPVNDYPIRKDDSDTMLATKIAIDMRHDRIILLCALGGRLDHTYANLQSLGFIADHGCVGELHSDDTHIITHTGGTITIPRIRNHSVSLFALSDICHDITLQGSGYDVEHIDLKNTFPLGLSNYHKSDSITLSMKDGILLVIQSLYVEL